MPDAIASMEVLDYEERACHFDCHGERLVGVLSLPAAAPTQGILMLVGGAQYRAGSHRQFTLLARAFAAAGIAVLRFDFRGMGDSEGEQRDFESVGADIDCALTHFMQEVPGLAGVTLWGLCDGASAALLHAAHDRRVDGMVLVNPWARTESGQAQAYLRHYYRSHLFSKALWGKILCGRFDAAGALRSFIAQLRRAAGSAPGQDQDAPQSLPDRLRQAYERFGGPVLLVLCGNDLTAREFADLAVPGSRWHALQYPPRSERLELADANHTFSTRDWRDQVAAAVITWMRARRR
ncbi:hydrolase 1, exosortase A system-associated [Herbaspirillum robiniae]|nr:hydrolase 1, exosortase A system-associated [Herbaspirillum robiniae]